MVDILTRPLFMRSMSVACGILTPQSAMGVRRIWAKPLKKVDKSEVNSGLQINSGQETMDTEQPKKLVWTHAHRWELNILVFPC